MNTRQIHALHQGELAVQKRRNTPRELTRQMPGYVHADMPQQHAEFYSELPYLPLTTLDNRGRPWVSLLVTQAKDDPSIGIQMTGRNQSRVVAETTIHDPFVRALKQTEIKTALSYGNTLFAGVGIDFSNRRRNKFAGTVNTVDFASSGKISLNLSSNQHLGNCPKYITVRSLEHHRRNAEIAFDHFDALDVSLPESCKTLINQASTTFLATKHTLKNDSVRDDDQRDMGLNHRGGAPGFVRVYEDNNGEATTSYLILPDHSGNRFYQSLGNIQYDKQVGLIFPDFNTGDLLYLTGDAENLFDEEAEQLMPRVSLLTRIRVTGAIYIKQGLNLKMVSAEQLSPYNPPVRYLKHELEKIGRLSEANTLSDNPVTITLAFVKQLTTNVSTFTFQLSKPVDLPAPGAFGVFDFSGIVDSVYRHMDEANPQLVNEDYIRTWTLSSSPGFDAKAKQFGPEKQISVTVKRKPGGLISNLLHENAVWDKQNPDGVMHVKFKGTGLGFSCFSNNSEDGLPCIPSQMLWIAGGVGITPFMAMWDGILNVSRALPGRAVLSTDIVLLFAGRDDDMNLLRHFLESVDSLPSNVRIKVLAYQSISTDKSNGKITFCKLTQEFPKPYLKIVQRRLQKTDFENIDHLSNREVFLCGPDSLMKTATTALRSFGGDDLNIHQESYFF